MIWPPNYEKEHERRNIIRRIFDSTDDPRGLGRDLYADNPVSFINDWAITFDPRNPAKKLPAKMPFLLFDKQIELVGWLRECVDGQESGLIEKCRDMGATWLCCGFSVWAWCFVEGSAIGWGSRKQELVDRIGDPSSIFQKIRMLIDVLPGYLLPEGFSYKDHIAFMKVTGPHGATITGESGDNIGRGGRSSMYFKDESAHLERPEMIEAALGDNTDVQIDISSVNGINNVFHRKRHGGSVRVFVMDWRDHPGKDQKWYNKRRTKAECEGLLHLFSQEVDRDYSASVEGVLIPAKWVKASIDAHIKLGFSPEGARYGGFDVADEGGDTHALVTMHGIFIDSADDWGEGDGTDAVHKVDLECARRGVGDVNFDSVGVGAAAKNAAKRLKSKINYHPYSGSSDGKGHAVRNPEREYVEGKKNKDMFANTKAQDWWAIRDRFRKTYDAVVKGRKYTENELIIILSTIEKRDALIAELSQVTYSTNGKGQIVVDKNPSGTKSPNLADGAVMANTGDIGGRGPSMRRL